LALTWAGAARPLAPHFLAHWPVQAEDGLQPRVGLAEQVPAQRGDRGGVEGDQRNYRDQQHAGQDPGA
jgi:hypothetical protein